MMSSTADNSSSNPPKKATTTILSSHDFVQFLSKQSILSKLTLSATLENGDKVSASFDDIILVSGKNNSSVFKSIDLLIRLLLDSSSSSQQQESVTAAAAAASSSIVQKPRQPLDPPASGGEQKQQQQPPKNSTIDTALLVPNNKKEESKRKPRRKIIPINKAYYIDKYGDSDILLGRGGRSNHHPGNKIYRDLVTEHQPYYRNCDNKSEKTKVAQAIVDLVQRDHKGRFLELDKEANRWYIVPNIVARRKVGQALRENNTEEARAMKREKYGQGGKLRTPSAQGKDDGFRSTEEGSGPNRSHTPAAPGENGGGGQALRENNTEEARAMKRE
eukprot:scaffold11305_cov74-Cylindrotheca_fusiformis.AAC.1